MAENKVIFENQPKSYFKNPGTSALFYGALSIFLCVISRRLLALFFWPVMFLVDLANYELSFNTYEGWRIESDEIILMKSVLRGLKIKEIKLDSILGISYFKGGGRSGPARLIFKLEKEETNCNVYRGIFELAGTLKFFQSKGIAIKLLAKDEEVQMYLDGKIESVPMSNA